MRLLQVSLVPVKDIFNGLFRREETRSSFSRLPNELVLEIFKKLPLAELARVPQVSRRFRDLSQDRLLWKMLIHVQFPAVAATVPPECLDVDWRGMGQVLLAGAALVDSSKKMHDQLNKIEIEQDHITLRLLLLTVVESAVFLRIVWMSPVGSYISQALSKLQQYAEDARRLAEKQLNERVEKCLNSGLETTRQGCLDLFQKLEVMKKQPQQSHWEQLGIVE